MLTNQPHQTTDPQSFNPVCPECGDTLHPMANFCPRCFVPIFPDPNLSETVREISEPGSADCFILHTNTAVVPIFSQPNIHSRRLFVMTGNDVVLIVGDQDKFYKVATFGGIEGYVPKSLGIKVKVGLGEVDESTAWGFFRVNEYLIGWKGGSRVPYKIQDAPIKLEPFMQAHDLARIKSDVVLPVVGETYGWFEVQLPSSFRGWVPEAYGYRMLRNGSLPEVTKPLTAGEILAGIVGVAAVVTLAGIGAAVSSIASDR